MTIQETAQAALRQSLVMGEDGSRLGGLPKGPFRLVATRPNYDGAEGFGNEIWFEICGGHADLGAATTAALRYREYAILAEWAIEVYPADGPAVARLAEVR